MNTLTTLFVLATCVLATARLTRLITVDKLLEPLRDFVIVKCSPDDNLVINRPPESKLVYLIHCPWCSGMWLSFIAWPVTWYLADLDRWLHVTAWFAIPAGALALSHLIGLLRGLEATD